MRARSRRQQTDGPWAGVDVGGAAKGFHVAVIDPYRSVRGPEPCLTPDEVVASLLAHRPTYVAVDCPRGAAPEGRRSRDCEREFLAAGICGIRPTPGLQMMREHPAGYYGWILNGLDLYAALERARPTAGWRVIECFPTATWTRLGGPKGVSSRASWSASVLSNLGLRDLRSRMSQDDRDAIGAAYTAHLADRERTEAFGDIIVPLPSA